MRRAVYLAVAVAVLAGAVPPGQSQDSNSLLAGLKAKFTLTQTSADKSELVTAGSVLVLQKDRLVMYAISNALPPQSLYKKGKISHSVLGGKSFLRDLGNTMQHPEDTAIQQRVFVAGEKFWVTGITVGHDAVTFRLYSDPYSDIRYWGELKFPFPKGSVPPADDLMNTIAEVLTIQPDDNAAANTQQAAPSAPAPQAPATPETPAEVAPAPIPPPPPPAPDVQPKTISLGQTRDEVVAIFGQPQKVVKLAAKQIYYYPDMKVTLVNGKVSDVAEITPAH
jgi:hypothetical protein